MRAGVLASLLLLVAVSARAGSALDGPPFSASPQDLLAAARAAQPSDEDVVLRANIDVAIDRGRITYHWHALVAVRTDDGADTWSGTGDTYRASDQHSTVRARVIDPQGQVHVPDPSQVTDEPTSGSGSAASDEHRIDVPFTADPGSVVEIDLVRVDRAPAATSGAADYLELGNLGATSLTTLRLSAPAGEQPRVSERGLPAGIHREHAIANGRETWTYSLGPTDLPPREWDGVADAVQYPLVGISTIPAWTAVARELGDGIDRQIAAGPPAWPAELAKTPTLETARAITQWVRGHVRARHIAPDDAGFRATTPAAVLAAGAADDLSIAALTCALLREAGLGADVALSLRSFAEPRLASFELDAAIVRARIGGADVWIDPVHDHVPVGRLAEELHGRRVLLLGDTPAPLVTTPSTSAAENELREVRTFDAPPSGFVNVTELDRATGDLAVIARDRFAGSGATARAIDLAENRYNGALDSFTAPLGDLDAPAETTIVVTGTHRGASQLDGVHIYLAPRDVTAELPFAFDGDAPRRRRDLDLAMPFTHEIENRITWPDGYEAPEPAPDRVIELAGLRFTEQQRVDGHAFVVTYRLEATATHFTPDEVDAARDALKKLEPELIEIPSTAWQLYRKRELREAVAAARRVAELHSHEAVYRDRLAELLVNIGAGTAARREARIATKVEPKRAAPWMTLGWVLEHDAFARRWGDPGARAEARAALETAHKLDPADVDSAVNLAELLQVDARGYRVAGGADLREAIGIWREIGAHSTRHGVDLGRALLWNDEAADAEVALREATGSDRDPVLAVATALVESPDTAIAELAKRVSDPAQRQDKLVAAGRLALDLRVYPAARALLSGVDPAQLVAIAPLAPDDLPRLVRSDAPFVPSAAPADAVIELALERLHPDRSRAAGWDAATDREIAGLWRLPLAQGDPADVSIGMVEDVVRSTMDRQVDGDANAWRVDASLAGEHAVFYVAADHGRPKIVGAPDAPAGAGRHVLRLLARHEDAAAKRLLDWIASDTPRDEPSMAAFAALWGDDAPTDRAEMLLAGAALAAPTDAAHALPILTACNATTARGQLACDATAAAIYDGERRWPELLRLAAAWENRVDKAEAVRPAIARATALLHLGRFDAADDAAAAGLALAPSTPELVLVEAADALGRGAPTDAWLRALDVAKSPQATPAQLAYLGWLAVYTGGDLAAAADAVETGVKRQSDPDVIDALAAVELEAGQLAAGYADADRAMTMARRRAPTDADWYAFGRYWEQLGLRDDAIAAYQRVAGKPDALEASPAALAKARLAALGAKR